MNTVFDLPPKTNDYSQLNADQLRLLLTKKDEELNTKLKQKDIRIDLLTELLRLARAQRFAAQSEKSRQQINLFDEAELAAAIDELTEQLPEDTGQPSIQPAPKKKRQRGFSGQLERQRIELLLSDAEKAGAQRTFFTKVKEELEFIPARMKVFEYWQEKAVFVDDNQLPAKETLIAATRPVHPLGKCQASVGLLAYIVVSKYADGLPLYRMESIFKRHHGEISRSNMAHWIIRLAEVFKPLLNLMREVQNDSDYLQADETRIQVLKEDGRAAQSKSWMWVVRGGPPDKPAVLFTYDTSRAGRVADQLLADFKGTLQCDGYSAYAQVCKHNEIQRIGCWDHARRKFIDAIKAADTKKIPGKKAKPTKADVAVSKIGKLYRIEHKIADKSAEEKYAARQALSVPVLADLKAWLEDNAPKVLKGSTTRKAMDYTLNQWDTLTGYCEHGHLNISNVLAENAIRPFAVGRKAWLFADTPQGAAASAACYSLVETAKANSLEPYAYIHHVMRHIGAADTLEKWEALLPWNVVLEDSS